MEGTVRRLDESELVAQLDILSAHHEARVGENPPWTRDKMDAAYFGRLIGALAAGAVMGIMIIPFVSSMADDSINAVPAAMRDGSLEIGRASCRERVGQYV